MSVQKSNAVSSQLPEQDTSPHNTVTNRIDVEGHDSPLASPQVEQINRCTAQRSDGAYRIHTPPPRRGGYCGIVVAICATITFVVLGLGIIVTVRRASGFLDLVKNIPDGVTTVITGSREPVLPDKDMIVTTLQTASKLETLHYTTQEVVEEERTDCILGAEQLLYIIQGDAAIGVDLGDLNADDVIVQKNERRVLLRLPPVKRLYAHIDVDESDVYVYEIPPTCGRHEFEMMQDAQKHGQELIESHVNSEDMAELAMTQAKSSVSRFLELLGFEDIEFVIDMPDAHEIEGMTPPLSSAGPEDIPVTEQTVGSEETPAPTAHATGTYQPLPTGTSAIDTPPEGDKE